MNYEIHNPKEESEDFYSDDDLFKISSWGADLSFRELVQRYQDQELLKPELQRKYVWDKTEASRFIDSLLLGLPVPSIFLAKTKDEKLLIVDGYQRIMTVYDFIKGIFSGDGKVFKLSRSNKINQKWKGKAFAELNESEQRRIKNTTIHAIIFIQQHPNNDDTSLYQVFERINTSGRTLFPQEIRNCVYQGAFNNLLFELNIFKPWRLLFGNDEQDQRMRDIELILRFFALSSKEFSEVDKEQISLKKFLNQYMGIYKDMDEGQVEYLRNKFKATIQYISDHLGNNAFNNISITSPEKYSPILSSTIFDSIAIATSIVIENEIIVRLDDIDNRRRALLFDKEYRSYITQETMRVPTIQNRIKKVLNILYQKH